MAPPVGHVSLEGVHGSVELPDHQAGFWRQWRAFSGPAILVSVGYMDPGNWGTDLQGGAQFKYGLLWVVGLASLMAIFMQVISARLGVVTGKDLAQCCRDWYPRWTRWPNWLLCEVAIGACDLAEVLGSAVALNLMFHIPLLWAVIITGLDVLLLLGLQRFGMRTIEAVVLLLVATISVCYFIEIFVLPQTQPSFSEMGRALVSPNLRQAGMIYVAIGIIGATVMPHNLYLHSALVQSRKLGKDEPSIRRAIRFNTIDSVVALTVAFFVNAAILVLAAMVFFGKDERHACRAAQVVHVQPRQRLDSHRLPDAGAAAGNGRRQHAVRRGPAGQRAEQHHHRHAGRAGGDGRLHALADLPLGAAAHHPHPGHSAGGLRHRSARRQQRDRPADSQPGGAGPATAVRHVPAPAFHLFPQENGRMETRLVPADRRLGQRPADYRDGHLRLAGLAARGLAGHRRRMTALRCTKGTPMYKTILVTLDATPTDRAIIEHVKKLAKFMKSRVVLLHVATGAVAQWHGPNAAGEEVEEGQAYLDGVKAEFEALGIPADAELAYGRRRPSKSSSGSRRTAATWWP